MLSPYNTIRGIKPKQPPQANFDLSVLLKKMEELDNQVKSVRQLKIEMKQDHQNTKEQMVKEHQAKLAELEQVFGQVRDVASRIQKGDPGKDAEPLDEENVVKKVLSQIRQPNDGQDAFVDETAIVKKVLAKIPKPKDGKTPVVDHQEIVDKVFEELKSGKKKLSHKHIGDFTDGLEQTIAPIRSLAAGFRGGGDIVKAGTGITIIVDADGKKVITNTGSSITLVDNEVVSGSGTTFTLADIPVAGTVKVYALGQRLTLTTDFSIVGKNITTVGSWNAGEIICDYQK